jgi:hypothetical protein
MKLGRPANWSIERCLATVKICGPWACWKSGSSLRNGYARLSIKNKGVTAHRAVFEYLLGPISPQLTLDHLCRRRWCINPNHLEPVPEWVNVQRGISPISANVLKTVCPKGHPYSPKNTGIRPNSERYCLACSRARGIAARRAKGIKPRRVIPYEEIIRLRLAGKTYSQIKTVLHVDANAIARAVGENGLEHTRRLKRFSVKQEAL